MLNKLFQKQSEEGQGLVEYALILVLVSITVVAILSLLGNSIGTVFWRVDTVLSGQSISGNGTEYIVGGFSASSSGGPAVCSVQTSSLTVTVLQNGQPAAAGQTVSISLLATGGGSKTASAATNADGQASFGAQMLSGNCSGTVTVSAGSSSRNTTYRKE